jgi:hypothetical protein
MGGPEPTTASKTYRFDDPPSNDPSTLRTICRPTVLPIVRAALFTIACTTVSPRREPPEPSTPPSAAPADSNHPPPEFPATPPAGTAAPAPAPKAAIFPFNLSYANSPQHRHYIGSENDFPPPGVLCLKLFEIIRHPDRSAAEWRNLLFVWRSDHATRRVDFQILEGELVWCPARSLHK